MKVLIGIQARINSTRFPRKVFALLRDRPLLWYTVQEAHRASAYINKHHKHKGRECSVALVCPDGDKEFQFLKWAPTIYWGSENDVLSRYAKAVKESGCDYIVRVTSDCPLIPSPLISKMITYALENGYDYVSNVGDDKESCRTAPDGFDCEVLSKEAVAKMDSLVTDKHDREHVTTYMRREMPSWAKRGHMIGYMDLAGIKLSVDTPEDLERVSRHFDSLKDKYELAEKLYGKIFVHRF